jgi:hypothetical protein
MRTYERRVSSIDREILLISNVVGLGESRTYMRTMIRGTITGINNMMIYRQLLAPFLD